jgi:FtsP/CotA-like multicopper oxidase with cupredoxin domain
MSGAIVVEGIARQVPALAKMPEHILIVRELGNNGGEARHHDSATAPSAGNVPCAPLLTGDYITVNSELQPTIRFSPGRAQFFRILNATGHRHIDLTLGGIAMHIVGVDGYPVDSYPGEPSSYVQTHIVVPPAARVEFFATLTKATDLRSQCFDSGPTGDSDPPELLAHLRPYAGASSGSPATFQPSRAAAPPSFGTISQPIPAPAATRLVRFTENAKGFYINGRAYSPDEKPVFVVKVGTVERWTVKNFTLEDHDFHLHQVHFHVETVDGVAASHQLWQDTVVVPHGTLTGGTLVPGSITLIADFRAPQIRGTFLFHCHILDHEDKGMMAKIQAI